MSEPQRELSEDAKWALQDPRTCDFAVALLAARDKPLDDAMRANLLAELEECRQRFHAALAERLHDRP